MYINENEIAFIFFSLKTINGYFRTRVMSKKSSGMKISKFGLQFLLDKGVQVVEMVTDAHEALMSKHTLDETFVIHFSR